MTVAFRAAGTIVTGANPATVLPTGWQQGDLFLLIATSLTAYSATAPTGYTPLDQHATGSPNLVVFYKFATASESAPSLTNASASSAACLVAYSGVGSIDNSGEGSAGTGTSAATTGITTAIANDVIVSVYGGGTTASATGTWTANASTTSRTSRTSTTALTSILVADENFVGPGTTTGRAATNGKSIAFDTLAIALAPVSSSGVGSSTGAATAQAVGQSEADSVGSSTGAATAQAVGLAQSIGAGSSTGTATAQATGIANALSVGHSTGAATAQAVGLAIKTATVSVAGGNWSSTGTWVSGVVPDAATDVILASTSGNLTVDGTSGSPSLCRSLSCTTTGSYTGTLTFGSVNSLAVGDSGGGSLTLSAGMTLTITPSNAHIDFVSTTTGNTITTAGKTMPITSFSGSGGAWALQDDYTATSTIISCTAGTLTTNNHNITGAALNGSGTFSLTLGTSTITATTSGGCWSWTSSGTLSAASSTISLTSSGGPIFAGGGQSYGTVSFTQIGSNAAITGADTFTNLSITSGANVAGLCTIDSNITVSSTLTLAGNSVTNRLLFCSSVYGTNHTVTAATVTASNVNIGDITGAGAGNWNLSAITGLSGDCGGNSGITFTTPITCFLKTAVSVNYSASNWFTTSGGSTGARVPLPQDTVRLDANSVTAASVTLTFNLPRIGAIDATGVLNTPAFSFSTSAFIHGSLTVTTAITASGNDPALVGRGSQTLSTNGVSLGIGIRMASGNYTVSGTNTFTGSNGVQFVGGTVNFGSSTINAKTLNLSNIGGLIPATPNNITVNYGSAIFNLSGTNSIFSGPGSTTGTNTSTINITDTSATGKTFSSNNGGTTYYNVNISGAASNGTVSFSGAASTFNIFTVAADASIVFPSSKTTTIARFFALGTSGHVITIASSSSGVAAIISQADHNVNCDWLSLKDSTATGGATFYAGANSTSVSGNTGWSFTSNVRTISVAGGNWSATTAWVEGSVPTATNDVIANSSSGNLTVDGTTGTPSLCNGLDFTGYIGTLTMGANAVIQMGSAVAGDLVLVSGMTFTPSASSTRIYFASSTTGNNITTAGKTMPGLIFGSTTTNATTAGTWTQTDNLSITFTGGNSLIFDSGTYNTNNFNITVNSSGTLLFATSNPTLNLGSSIVTCGSFDVQSGTPTINFQTSTVNCTSFIMNSGTTVSAASSTINAGSSFFGQGNTYGTVALKTTLGGTGDQGSCVAAITGANTFTNLTLLNNQASGTSSIAIGANQTITTSLSMNGNSATSPLILLGVDNTIASIRPTAGATPASTLTCNGTISASYLYLGSITGAGSASWDLASITGNSGDMGGNSGITFTTPTTCFYKTSSATSNFFHSSQWFTASGGSTPTRIPLPQDTATFDNNSFQIAGSTFTFGNSGFVTICPSIDLSAVLTNLTTITFSGSVGYSFCGDLKINSSYTISGSALNGINFFGRSASATITLGTAWSNILSGHYICIFGFGNTYTFSTNTTFPTASDFVIASATVNFSGTFSCGDLSLGGFGTGIALAPTTLNLTGNLTVAPSVFGGAALVVVGTSTNTTTLSGTGAVINVNSATAADNTVTFGNYVSVNIGGINVQSNSSTTSLTMSGTTGCAVALGASGFTNTLGSIVVSQSATSSFTCTGPISCAGTMSVTATASTTSFSITGSVSATTITLSGNSGITSTMGSGTWTATGAGTPFNIGSTGITTSSANLAVTDTSASTKSLSLNGHTYNNLTISGAASNGTVTLTGANTFNVLTINPNCSIIFPATIITTVTQLVCAGTTGNVITFTSSSSGTAAKISQLSGVITGDFMSIKDSTAQGGATFYAGSLTDSTNVSGNTGWIFSTGVTAVGSSTGSSTVQSIGVAQANAIASSTGLSTVQSIGIAQANGVATSTGTATVQAVGSGQAQSIASSTGTATVQAIGSSTALALASSTGTATVQAVGSGQAQAIGSSTGTAAVQSTGISTALALASSTGTATVQATGISTARSVGSSTGAATVQAVGNPQVLGIASSTGTATVQAVGSGQAQSIASSTGTATVQATGISTARSTGSSTGAATVQSVGIASATAVGSSTGAATATAVGNLIASSTGSSTGAATAQSTGISTARSVGSSTGAATVQAVGSGQAQAIGSSTGTATVQAIGAPFASAIASSTGTATVQATGISTAASTASSTGTATVQATGISTARSVGNSTGAATAQAIGSGQTQSVGSSTGTATVQATGISTAASTASSTGAATAQSTGISTARSAGSSTGAATASAAGSSTAKSTASSTGTATVQGVGSGQTQSVGSSTGTATVQATGISTARSVGNSTGAATVQATGISTAKSVGSSTGAGAGLAVGSSTARSVGSSTGAATVQATGRTNRIVTIVTGSYALTGNSDRLLYGRVIAPVSGSYIKTGYSDTFIRTAVITAAKGTYTQTGEAARLLRGSFVFASNGFYDLTGSPNINFSRGIGMFLANGTYTLTGQNISFLRNRVFTTTRGHYNNTGEPANLHLGRKVFANHIPYNIISGNNKLEYHRIMPITRGTYSLTGEVTTLHAHRVIHPTNGNYVDTGGHTKILAQRIISPHYHAYNYTGHNASVLRQKKLAVAYGAYTKVGHVQTYRRDYKLHAPYGYYFVPQYGITTPRTYELGASVGTYTEIGYTIAQRPTLGNVVYVVGIYGG